MNIQRIWRLLPITLAQILCLAVIPAIVSISLPLILDKKGLEIGPIMSVYYIALVVGSLLLGGWLTDSYGPKKVLQWTAPFYILILTCYPFAQSLWQYLVIQIMNGLILSLLTTALIILARSIIPAISKIQAQYTGMMMALNYIGSGLAMLTGIRLEPYPPLLWSTVIILSIWGVFFVFYEIGLVHKENSNETEGKRKPIAYFFVKEAHKISLPDIGVSSAYVAFITFFALLAGEIAGTILFLCTVVTGLASITFVPKLVVKNFRFVMLASHILLIASFILIRFGDADWILVIAGCLIGVGISGNNLSITEGVHTTMKKLTPEKIGASMATVNFYRQSGGIISPILFGTLRTYMGKDIWLIVALFIFGSVVLTLLMKDQEVDKEQLQRHQMNTRF